MLEEKINQELLEFLKFFRNCPICFRENDTFYLESLYFSDKPEIVEIKKRLLSLMKKFKYIDYKSNKITLGIPCCECFETVFGYFPIDIFDLTEFDIDDFYQDDVDFEIDVNDKEIMQVKFDYDLSEKLFEVGEHLPQIIDRLTEDLINLNDHNNPHDIRDLKVIKHGIADLRIIQFLLEIIEYISSGYPVTFGIEDRIIDEKLRTNIIDNAPSINLISKYTFKVT